MAVEPYVLVAVVRHEVTPRGRLAGVGDDDPDVVSRLLTDGVVGIAIVVPEPVNRNAIGEREAMSHLYGGRVRHLDARE